MKAYKFIALAAVLCLIVLAAGCKRSDKAVGPEPVLPQNGIQLMFAQCDPFAQHVGLQESITLVADPLYACSGIVSFVTGLQAAWQSGGFRVSGGDIREGYHLVFQRPLSDASTDAIVQITYQGIAASFVHTDTIPAGTSGESLLKVVEIAQTGTVTSPDSLHYVRITVALLSGRVNLNLDRNADGSYLRIGVDASALCQFKILYDNQHGTAHDSMHVFDVLYDHSPGNVHDSVYLDFTHGAHMVAANRLQLGDKYGVAYLAAESEGCRDTASYWAIPPSQAFREDTIGYFDAGNIISDGNSVWFYDAYSKPDSTPCRIIRVSRDRLDGFPVVRHPVYNCDDPVTVAYDRETHLIWIVEHSTSGLDTAWGYTPNGQDLLDSTFTSASIPSGFLYRGFWVQESSHDALQRTVVFLPLHNDGGPPVLTHTYPAELTEQFAGGAGIGFPGAGRSDTAWTVNAFDYNGDWIGQFPVQLRSQDQLYSVTIVEADSVIVYSVLGNFADAGYAQHVRKISPR